MIQILIINVIINYFIIYDKINKNVLLGEGSEILYEEVEENTPCMAEELFLKIGSFILCSKFSTCFS